jgi:DNA-binding HxlR family transcriptional regulator
MVEDSDIIRTEIIRVLNESGTIRGNDLVNRVTKKVGSEKLVYREIGALVESGEIEKKIHTKFHIEYKLVNLSESANKQLKSLYKEIKMILDEIDEFNQICQQNKISFQERLHTIIHFIHIIQSTDGIMKLLLYYPAFKKDKMFSQIQRKISDSWENILENIAHQPEEEFLNEVIANLRISQINYQYVN